MFTLVVVASTVGGLAIGSFLNVVIYRVPRGQSIVTPASSCPTCGAPVAARDNIPVISWVVLRGRCRGCQSRIAVRYPVVEALTAVLFALTAVRLGVSWSLPAELAFVGGVIALAAVDLERLPLAPGHRVPDPGRWSVSGCSWRPPRPANGPASVSPSSAAWAAFAAFYALHFARPAWLGFGDVRLAGLLGLALGWMGPWYLLIGLMAANLVGAVVGVGLILAGKATRRTAMPYGVFLAAGCIIALLVGGSIISWYSHHLVR